MTPPVLFSVETKKKLFKKIIFKNYLKGFRSPTSKNFPSLNIMSEICWGTSTWDTSTSLNTMSEICWDTSTSSQVSNCDGVVLETYLDHKFQQLQEGLNCESLAYEVVT